MADAPKISLCLIVRDEEDFIAGCLESAAPVVHEIVVVDTGSTDRTMEIARYFNAQVVQFTWIDDFSAARNAALDAATGDFVLFLDADERLSGDSYGPLMSLLEADDPEQPTLYLPQIVNVDAEGRHLGADHMARLWRHQPWIRFEGRIHEQAVAQQGHSVRMWFVDQVQIVHLGYDPGLMAARGKHARNLKLLEAEMQARPDDPQVWFHLARQHYSAGDNVAALPLLVDVIEHGGAVNHALSATVFAVECLRSLGQPEEALELALGTLKTHPDYGTLAYVAGQAAMESGRPIQGAALFKQGRLVPAGLGATAFQDPSVARWRADLAQANALMQVGLGRGEPHVVHYAEQAKAVLSGLEGVVPEGDDLHQYTSLKVQALLATGDEQVAWAELQALIEAAPGWAVEPTLQLAERYLSHTGPEQALSFLEQLIEVHEIMGQQVEVLSAAASAAQMAQNTERQAHWLKILVAGGSPVADHYLQLATLLTEAGALESAQQVAALAAALMEPEQ
ncbi:MAG: glycosyltransferase [Bradymonadia bacterium]